MYEEGLGVRRDRKKAAAWFEKGGGVPDKLQKQREKSKAVGHWIMRVFADAALVGCFFAGLNGLSWGGSREDLIGAAYLGTLALIFHALAFYLRPLKGKRAPRRLHLILAAILLVFMILILSVFLGGGVVDPEDVWILGWLAALFALALWRGFRKKKE